MVITEKQNLQTTQSDRRHRRMLERMNRMLVSPRLLNRPRPEWNSQSQTLRSMDLFGLERDTIDMGGHPSIVQSLFQSVFDSWSPQSHTDHPVDHHGIPAASSSQHNTIKRESQQGELEKSEVRIIPITFLDKSGNQGIPLHSGSESPKPILISDLDEVDTNIVVPEVIECSDTDTVSLSSKSIKTNCDTQKDYVDVEYFDMDSTPTKSVGGGGEVIDCDTITIRKDTSEFKGIELVDERENISVDNTRIVDCDTTSLVRQSLPRLSLSQRSMGDNNLNKNDFVSDEVLMVDCAETFRERKSQIVRTVRSNKDTLVGGANKVLGDVGPDEYYKGGNLDIPPGASYGDVSTSLSVQVHTHSDEEKPVNEVPNYPIYSILKKKLMKECRQIDYIKGDGNCFFRALSKQLYGSERYHIVLRNLIVDIIATNKTKFSQFVDGGDVQDHVERMSQEQSWATTCEIYAAATLLQRDVFMLTPDHLNETYSWLLFKPVFKMDTQHSNIESHPCYITLCNTNGNHYDRIVGEHGGCNCFLPHPELDGVSYSVDLTC